MSILIFFVLCILSGIAGRCGGSGNKPCASWMRDWVCPALFIAALPLFWHIQWGISAWIACAVMYGLTGGAFSTYWDEVFGFDNYWFSGFIVGLAAFPIGFITHHWIGLVLRCFVLAIAWGLWHLYHPKNWTKDAAVTEDLGRYSFYIASMVCFIWF